MEEFLFLIISGWLVAAFIMFILWLSYLYKKDPAVVDIGWSASIGCAAWLMLYTSPISSVRNWVIISCVTFWSLRLTSLLITRMWNGQKDQRYVTLSLHWKNGLYWKYFLFYQAQAFSVALLTIPIALSFLTPKASWTLLDIMGILIYSIGMIGEWIADRQMKLFRDNPGNSKKVCNRGLWRYSRHPNYFFESMIWVSYATIAMNHPFGLIGWISPAVIIISILKVTGIPPTEQRLLASKGDAYREYQHTTSMFIPMPPRN